jgi:hypothetical protein
MDMNNNSNRQQQGGTGSAEQTGRDRSEQQSQKTHISDDDKQDIASAIGEDSSRISTIEELGGLSGRDDSSGGTGDHMEQQSSNEPTDR